jgi:replicative DNA helicase
MIEISAEAQRLKQKHDLTLIVIGCLQLMTSARRSSRASRTAAASVHGRSDSS